MNAPAPKEKGPEFGHFDAKLQTFASEAAAALYIVISAATGSDDLDRLVSQIWQGVVHGAIDEGDADFLQSFAERRRPLACGRRGVGGRGVAKLVSRFVPRQRARSYDRQASRERRRTLGGSAVMPPNLRCHFTEGQRAVLCILAGEVKHHGLCDLAIDKIAALAGVCRTTVQNTLHEARRLGHIKVTERPQPGRKNLTNVVHIVSAEWITWIKRGPSAHRPGRTGSNPVAEKNLRRDETSVSPTKSTYKKYSCGQFEQRRSSGPLQARWRRRE
ncbi:hypothetical protein C5688_08645 [Methylocystis sp. MitZ-2018]|nr:hypothetical protein C5688_08645 [Methylocystis sp. MitZ-2018]